MLGQSSACSWLPGFDPETWRTSFQLWGRYVYLNVDQEPDQTLLS